MIDFLVIGGGIAGISAAARLSKLGQVTVLEAEKSLAYHTSGRSAAMFEETYGNTATVAMNRASRDFLTTANGGVLSPRGLMLIGSANDEDLFERDLKQMELERMSVAEARAIVPILNTDVITQVAAHADAWDIDTDLLIQNFAREVRANGGIIQTGQQVTKIVSNDNAWDVITPAETFHAKVVVNAAGAWVDQIAEMAGIAPIGFTPLRRSMARIPAPGGHDVSAWPLMFGPGETWYAKPDAGKLIVSPAEEDLAVPHDAWADDMVLAEGLARYEAMVTEPVTRLETSWAGLRTFSPDRSFVIGPDPATPTFFWVAGQGGYGFQTSAAASQLVADLIGGRPNELGEDVAKALSPQRFR